MYDFAEGQSGLGSVLFLPWASWVLVWTAAMLLLLSLSGACAYIRRFTRFSGELFGGLIALLFMQQAIKVRIQKSNLCASTPLPCCVGRR